MKSFFCNVCKKKCAKEMNGHVFSKNHFFLSVLGRMKTCLYCVYCRTFGEKGNIIYHESLLKRYENEITYIGYYLDKPCKLFFDEGKIYPTERTKEKHLTTGDFSLELVK